MKNTLGRLREQFKTSLWPIPIMICLLMMGAALFALSIERTLEFKLTFLDSFVMSVDSARQLLGVIAGAVLSVGGVAFSVTMVALTLTSGQYGPKILRQFLGDTTGKVSLGVYLGTCLYALVTLAAYVEDDQPRLTVLAALVLMVLALVAFIQFIHRTATDLQADEIIRRIGSGLHSHLSLWAVQDASSGSSNDTGPWRHLARGREAYTITAGKSGYLQTVDYGGLVAWCRAHDCIATVRLRAGDFLLENTAVCRFYNCEQSTLAAAMPELQDFFIAGPLRTPVQDPEYPITQLNQLAARALSPGINDPGTAVTCIDWFCMAVSCVVDRDLPGSVHNDEGGTPRLLVRLSSFPGILKSFYAPFRQFSQGNIPVVVSLLESLVRLALLTHRAERLSALALHGQLIWDAVSSQQLSTYDVHDVRQRYMNLMRVTGSGPFAQASAERRLELGGVADANQAQR